jgi:hypothetical protein
MYFIFENICAHDDFSHFYTIDLTHSLYKDNFTMINPVKKVLVNYIIFLQG